MHIEYIDLVKFQFDLNFYLAFYFPKDMTLESDFFLHDITWWLSGRESAYQWGRRVGHDITVKHHRQTTDENIGVSVNKNDPDDIRTDVS